MYQKDYIIRFITQLFEALSIIINHIKNDDVGFAKVQIDDTYSKLGNDASFFLSEDIPGILTFFESQHSQANTKLNVLAKLMYYDSMIQQNNELKINMLKKSIELLIYHISISKEYSFENNNLLVEMKNKLNDL